jgi:type IV pilus assembly protein PilE
MMNDPTNRAATARRGFTLIEVMITVAIIAILAAIALPAYTAYVRRGQLSEAFTFLTDTRVKMEQYYQDQKSYGAAACADTNAPPQLVFPITTPTLKFFAITCTLPAGGQAFTLQAAGSANLTTGYTYTLDSAGTPATTQFAGATSTLNSCWATRSGTSCDN